MSELLSVVASIAGLVQISEKIIGLANQLYYSSKDAPESICRIKNGMGQLNLILRQIQRLIERYERGCSNQNRLTMIPLPLEELITILSGCVSVYSALDKKLSNLVPGLDETMPENPILQTNATSSAASSFMCVKWDLWKESEVVGIIGNIEQDKLSLLMMLTIIQR